MLKFRFVIFASILIFEGSRGISQTLTFYGTIPTISITKELSKKIKFNFFTSTTIDAFDRKIESVFYPSSDLQLYIQPSIVYQANKSISYSLSYTYQRNNPFRSIFVNEHRLWQQVLYIRNYSTFKWTNRLRVEERFIENKLTEIYPLSTRLRFQIGVISPFKFLNQNKMYWSAHNEFYFSLSGQKNALYSENWSYLGIGFELSTKNKIEFGYLFQSLVRNQQRDLRILHLAQFSWISNFDRSCNRKNRHPIKTKEFL